MYLLSRQNERQLYYCCPQLILFAKPYVFACKTCTSNLILAMVIMNIIVYSKKEGFEDGVKKLRDDSFQFGKICKIVETKDLFYLMSKRYFETTQHCIYFLSSDYRIPQFIKLIKKKNQFVINEAFLTRDILTSKFESLKRARRVGVCTPKHILLPFSKHNVVDNFMMPAFIKSKNPRGLVTYVNDKESLNSNLESLSEKKNYYLEENVKCKDNFELKIYYINGVTYAQKTYDTEANIPNWFRNVLDKISKCTGLNVFSADFFVNWAEKKYYCFDVNLASSFYKSDDARAMFIGKILK